MNWKNVIHLMRVERKSGRLLRGIKPTRYKENSFLAYWPYWLAIGVGIAIGLLAGFIANTLISSGEFSLTDVRTGSIGLFVTLPTLVLVYNLVLTLLQQIQRSGIKVSAQTPYWLPVTWQEHTLASVLASLLGIPIGSVLMIVSAIFVYSVFIGLILPATLAAFAVLAAAFMASVTTEILRILQVRFIGAVYKSSGRAAVWVRFVGSLGFFIIFYAIYFYIVNGGFTFVSTFTQVQGSVWFIPFVWLGTTLSYFLVTFDLLMGIVFLSLSVLFLGALYALAVGLNKRFGLYEPAAIKVQKSGVYTPKTGFLGKLGFADSEAAIIRKDLKAFTRRRELMTIFIAPIVIILIPLMQSLGITGSEGIPTEISLFYLGMTFLFPSAFMVMSLGNLIIGEEGQAIWRIYASPVSAKNLVKSKYFLITLFGFIILVITGTLGTLIYRPSTTMVIVAFAESIFLIFALGTISLNIGFKGADFTEIPRPRMVRQSWALINLAVCFLAGVGILSPIVPSVVASFLGQVMPGFQLPTLDPIVAVPLSGIIATVITVIFYKLTLDTAKDFLRKAEV
jgi:hypothetical protein